MLFIFIYFGVLVFLIAITFLIELPNSLVRMVLIIVILLIGLLTQGTLYNYFTESTTTQYEQIAAISKSINNSNHPDVKNMKIEITLALKDKKLTKHEFYKIEDAYNAFKRKQIANEIIETK